VPKTDTPGGRRAVQAARNYRNEQNKRHHHNLTKKRMNSLFRFMTGR
jgi:hypothetical protein